MNAGTLTAVFHTRWRAFGVLIAAVLVLGITASPAANFNDKISNDPLSFLPEGTESVAVAQALERFPGADAVLGVVVIRRGEGLTAADRQTLATIRTRASDVNGVHGQTSPPIVSPDRTTATLAVPFQANDDQGTIVEHVKDLRALVDEELTSGLEGGVTGPAAFSADAVGVFADINVTLFIAAATLVVILLLIIYRSPVFWIIPLASIVVAEQLARAAGSIAIDSGLTINGQTQGIALVLVFGVGTDYALLLVARYREELHRSTSIGQAMACAIRRAAPAVLASASTVIAGLLVLMLARVNGTAGLGPYAAIAVACTALSMLVVLPALLVLCGRWVFWPRIPRGEHRPASEAGIWRRIGEGVVRRPRPIWIGVMVGLIAMAGAAAAWPGSISQADRFRTTTPAESALELLASAFPAGASDPAEVVVPPGKPSEPVVETLASLPGVARVIGTQQAPPGTRIQVMLTPDPNSREANDLIWRLRDAVKEVQPGTLVGGTTAIDADYRDADRRDATMLPPIIALVVFVILVVLLRAIVAPLVLVATTIVSYLSALGVAILVFRLIGAPGIDTSLPLYAFVFLVALGIDYNIFLMARAREEVQDHGHREGMLRALSATGGVITSAGVVLAGTFAILCVLPLWALFQVGFTVAFGVLLDTFIVRTILVPAICEDIGPKTWWPSRLAREDGPAKPISVGPKP